MAKMTQIVFAETECIKMDKDVLAAKAIEFLGELLSGTGVYLEGCNVAVASVEVGHTALQCVLTNPETRGMATALVAHLVQDFANRINEGASLLEKVLEDPKVAASIANVKKAYEGLEALQKRQSAAVKEQVIEGLRVKSTHTATSKKKMGATWTRVKRDHI